MKLPKSSPGRTTEDIPLPPSLIMFPRSKSTRGSSSRSRANPMFIRKVNTVNEANQEPPSPKVTCIGQVRVKNRSNNNQTTSFSSSAVRRSNLLRKIKPRWFRRVWRTRISFFRCDCCRKSDELQERKENQTKREIEDVIGGFKDELESPPRNAFVLTRSRSAPYRYSSSTVIINRISESSRVEEEKEESEGYVINGDEEFIINSKVNILSRCKSEPARRTGDKLFMSFSVSS